MGIRFECPNGHRLNVKSHLAGKRGICPECQAKFTIPAPAEQQQSEAAAETPATQATASTVAPSNDASESMVVATEPRVAPQPTSLSPPPLPPTAGDLPDVWYVRAASGEQFGPANTETFNGWVAAGRVPGDALVWRTGWPEWKSGQAALSELNLPLAPPPQKPTAVIDEDVTAAPQPVDAYRSRQRQRRERAKLMTMVLTAVVFLLLVVLVVVLVKN